MGNFYFALDKLFEDAKAVETGHLDVHKYEVGSVLSYERDGFDAVFAFPDDIDFRETFEKELQLFARGLFVIDDDGINGHVGFRRAAVAATARFSRKTEYRRR